MPSMGDRVPRFLETMETHGWAAANQKRGGGTATVVGAYLADLPVDRRLKWWGAIIEGIPQSSHVLRDSIFAAFHATVTARNAAIAIEAQVRQHMVPVLLDIPMPDPAVRDGEPAYPVALILGNADDVRALEPCVAMCD